MQLYADDSEPFRAIDRHALSASTEAEATIEGLAQYLTAPADTDLEKVRGIFRWMTDRISYDVEGFLAGKLVDSSPEAVLKSRKGICAGYADLFAALCKQVNIEAVVVVGNSKGYGYVQGQKTDLENHAWNAVKLNGEWQLIDVTWAAGTMNDQKKFDKRLDDFFFLTPPDQMIFDHFPKNEEWQFLTPSIPLGEYEAMDKVDRGLCQALNLTGQQVRAKLLDKSFHGFVHVVNPGKEIHYHQIPSEKHLAVGSTPRFRIESPDFVQVAVIVADKWHQLTLKGNVFEGEVPIAKGKIVVSARMINRGDAFWPLLEYVGD